MTIQQTIDIPAGAAPGEGRRLTIEVPREIPAGPAVLAFTPAPAAREAAETASRRIGFLKGRVSVPSDFDTMGQKEIAALFGEAP